MAAKGLPHRRMRKILSPLDHKAYRLWVKRSNSFSRRPARELQFGFIPLRPSAYDVMRGSEDLLVTSPFADDLVVAAVSRRGLERTREETRLRESLQESCSHIGQQPQERTKTTKSQFETWTTVPSLQSLPIGPEPPRHRTFPRRAADFVVVGELVCTFVARCLKDLV